MNGYTANAAGMVHVFFGIMLSVIPVSIAAMLGLYVAYEKCALGCGGEGAAYLALFLIFFAIVYGIAFFCNIGNILGEIGQLESRDQAIKTAEEKRQKESMYNQMGKEGKWDFPTENFT